MKTILLSLLLLAAPPSVSAAVAWACDGDGAQKRVLVIPKGKHVAGDTHKVFVTEGEKDTVACAVAVLGDGRSESKAVWVGDNEPKIVWVGDKGSAKAKAKARFKSKLKDKYKVKKEGGGWLGVSIDTVPDVLARQFDLDGEGVIVVNVVGESPADRAGFEVYDVILYIDGDVVEGKVGKAVDLIKLREPGEKVEFVVLRKGDKKPITVKLGSRADLRADKLAFKFEGLPLAEVEERIKTRGKILRKGAGDKWIVEDLGDLRKLKNLPKHIEMFVPESGSRSTQIHVTGEERRITTRVQRDGGTIVITGVGDGPVKVVRIDEDGEKIEAEYDDEDELEEADTEAFLIWEDVGDSVVVRLNLDRIEIPDFEMPDIDIEIPDIDFEIPDVDFDFPEFRFEFDSDEFEEHAEEWSSHLEESLGEAMKSYELAMEEYKKVMEQWRENNGPPKGIELKHWPPMAFPKDGRSKALQFYGGQLGKPKHSFEVDTDGTIEVRIRKGDSEMVRVFEDEDDLARRSPKLFKKYTKLMDLERE